MRDHEDAKATGIGRDRSSSRRADSEPSGEPAGLLGLQASVGNTAVVQMLRRSGRTEVQRSAVHDVLRAGGRPLDEGVRTDMEARLGADFSDVRVHSDARARASAAAMGARAYTSGNHIVIGDGGGDAHTLAHELTHVIQQRRGPVAGTETGDGLRVSDPSDRFEREGEATAHRVMRAAPAGPAAHGPARGPADASGATPAGRPAVQRLLVLGQKGEAKAAEPAYADIRAELTDPELISAWEDTGNKPAIMKVLDEWITAPKQSTPQATANSRRGPRDALGRSYATMDEAAAAVLDRVNALPVAEVEKAISDDVAVDAKIREVLAGFVANALRPWLGEQRKQAAELEEMLSKTVAELASVRRLYLPYIEFGEKTLDGILGDPQAQGFATLISAIHDIAEILYGIKDLEQHVTVSAEQFKGYVFKDGAKLGGPRNSPAWALGDGAGQPGGSIDDLERTPVPNNFRGTMATPNQLNDQVRTAGRLGYPVSLGPSRTTGKLMKLADTTGADPAVKEAIAYALLALWYTDYRRDLTDIHRYHFVMDMAANFGVAYDPYQAPRNPATGGDYSQLIAATLDRFRKNHEEEAARYWKKAEELKLDPPAVPGPVNGSSSAAGAQPAQAVEDAVPAWRTDPVARAVMSALKAAPKFRITGEKQEAIGRLQLTEAQFDAAFTLLTSKDHVGNKPLVQLDRMGLVLTNPGRTAAKKAADL
ncbi:eCIS core domain-containing protein [Streptomyces sp. HF10]|uniref:eCIS core domain-containing protein n=1 Tax=Streptomyces sp. HF10 TaxID=2692233 RepID=UPI003FA7768A